MHNLSVFGFIIICGITTIYSIRWTSIGSIHAGGYKPMADAGCMLRDRRSLSWGTWRALMGQPQSFGACLLAFDPVAHRLTR